MKKFTSILLALAALLALCACGAPKTVKQTDNILLEQIAVDDSYRDSDNSPRRAVYAFFSLTPTAENITFDCKHVEITINETNTYSPELLPGSLCNYSPAFYYGGYLETAYVGETKKFVVTFLIPEGDLAADRSIAFSSSQIADLSQLVLSTDDITHVNGDDKVGELADPEGYLEMQEKFSEAPAEQAEIVKSMITGRYWEAYVNPIWYRVSFPEMDRFTVDTTLGQNGGTYSVRNGYIFCTYDSNGATIKIPYEVVEGQGVTMDLGETFRSN